jgi:hypothetical protein
MSAKGSRSDRFYGVGAGLVNLYASPAHKPQATSVAYDSESTSGLPLRINNFCAIPATVDNRVMLGIVDVPSTDALAFQPIAPIGPGALNLYGSVTHTPTPAARTTAAAAA